MSPDLPAKTIRRDLTALLALALVAGGLAAAGISQPGYTDAYYYFDGAVQLGRGRGYSEPYVWNYLAPAAAMQSDRRLWPSHLYWMPLASLVAAPFVATAERAAGGPLQAAVLFRAAQVPFILAGGLMGLLGYWLAERVTHSRRSAWLAGLLTLFSPFYFYYWPNTDAFALHALAGGAAFLTASLAERQPARQGWWQLGAGLSAGLAHLARADGILVLLTLLAWHGWRELRQAGKANRLRPAAGALGRLAAGYLIVMAPWFGRNLALAGFPLAPGGWRTAWLVTYDEFFALHPEVLTVGRYLASGWSAIASAKLWALQINLTTLLGPQSGVVAAPFAVVGFWQLRRSPAVQLALVYGAGLLVLMTAIFTFPGARGGYFHSGALLLPFIATAAAVGLDKATEAAASRLKHWQPERAKRVFGAMLAVVTALVAGVVYGQRVLGLGGSYLPWPKRNAVYAEVAAWLAEHSPSDGFAAVNDPAAWYYFTGQPAIVIPAGGPEDLLEATVRYGARWVALDENHSQGLAGLYAAPDENPRLRLRAQFDNPDGQATYLLEVVSRP